MNDPIGRTVSLPSSEITLADILAFAHRYWFLVGVVTALAITFATIFLLYATPKYTASAQILIETGSSQVPMQLASESLIALDTPQIESQIALLRSEQIAGKVAKLLEDHRKSAGVSSDRSKEDDAGPSWWSRLWPTSTSQIEIDPAVAKKNAQIQEIEAGMEVKRVGLSYALDVSFQATDPRIAAFVANAIGDTYVEDSIATRAEDARRRGVWLEGRIEELRHLMNEAAIAVQEFKARRDYRIYDTGKGDQSALKIEEDRGLQDPLAPPKNSDTQGAHSDKPSSSKSSSGLSSPAEMTSLEELESKSQTYRKLYESYLQAYTDTIPKQSFPGTNARVITQASIPTKKSSPKRLFTLVAATFLGGLLGLGIALVHSVLDTSLHSANQMRRNLHIPVLGEVNNSLARNAYVPNWLRKLRRVFAPTVALDLVRHGADSPAAREMMATALSIKEAAGTRGSKIVGILGISSDQNGTLLSCNFAVACAQIGARTLLVELNEKRHGMLSALSPKGGEGLQKVLRGEIGLDAALEPVPSEPALQLLAAYQANPNVAWTREEVGIIRGYLEKLSDRFDLIFVDLPPKTSVVYPCALAVDSVVLVGSADRSKMSEISDAALFLRGVGKQILGVVISRLA
jgi:uncharacterized protein involved in exopolysaccharide biosynthesis/Mrp family chromosome partitioning ATPase